MSGDTQKSGTSPDAHTIRIGKFDVKVPMQVAPKLNTRYWCTDLDEQGLSQGHIWSGSARDIERLNSGRCHALQVDADLHGRALLSFTLVDQREKHKGHPFGVAFML